MTNVNVGYGIADPSHDLSLSDGSTTLGLIYPESGVTVLQEVPLSPPAQEFAIEQKNWIGGRMRIKYDDDPTGFFDSQSLWSTSEGKLMPMLQWRLAKGLRDADVSLPTDNSTMAWWKLYGNDPTNKIARYLSVTFTASASYSANDCRLWIRRRGTPVSNLLTFELCANNAGSPGSVLQTVTKTITDITDTVSIFHIFDWTGTQALVSGTVYHVKVYGGSSDTAANHWEVLCDSASTNSKYSTDNSAWTTSTVSMYYCVADSAIGRAWHYFQLEGALYAVSQNNDGSTSLLKINGVRGTATAATSTTLTCSALAMTSSQYIGAYIRIYDGTGDGQIRQITANTSTQFTVATWDITPDTTSRFVVYGTDYWTTVSGTPGLTSVKSKPIVTNGIAYLPQGQAANIRRMRVNGNSHDFADDGTNKADYMSFNVEGATPLVYTANAATATIASATAVTWGTNLTFGTSKNIGGSEYRITNLYSHNKIMHIFKEDGVYTYNNGIIEKLGSSFADAPTGTLGAGVGSQNNMLWFGWGHSLERMTGASIDDMLNFKRGYDGVPNDRVGSVSAVVSGVGWLFFSITASTYSSIICWNGFGFHEIFRGYATNKRIRNMVWQPCEETRPRLWFSYGGEMVYIEFPLYAANPLKDTTINYQHEGVLITPTYDKGDPNLYKILGLLRVLSDQGTVEIDYQTNASVGTSTWTVLGTASTQPATDMTLNLGGILQVRFRFRLQVTASRTPTILTGWQLSGRMAQLKKYQWLATFRADSDATTYTDEPDHNPDTLYAQLQTWFSSQTKLTLRSVNQSADQKIVTVTLPSKSVDWVDTGENKWGGRISLALLET